jgi:hypothetical protein
MWKSLLQCNHGRHPVAYSKKIKLLRAIGLEQGDNIVYWSYNADKEEGERKKWTEKMFGRGV